ncbi:MAG: phospholipase [Thermoanaerobaculia bacterium]|nr:phospholipase [Thermoanaerobaculia bacterium]
MGGDGESLVRRVDARVHGRYLKDSVEGTPRGLLVGFHGFGESADDNLRELRRLPGLAGWRRVAVEALHPFYTRSGDVVACWMTRQDRELAIEENVAYVRTVLGEVTIDLPSATPIALLGFSQGTAMAYRAGARGGIEPAAVVALAGDVPPELAELDGLPFSEVLIARGSDEEWYTPEQVERDVALLEGHGIVPTVFEFRGGHEWTDAFRRETSRFLGRVASRRADG